MAQDVFSGMVGMTLDSMLNLAGLGRHIGKLQLCRHGNRWVLLFFPPGKQESKTYYLMSEKSRRPRLFAKADTALAVASTMGIPGLWVRFHAFPVSLVARAAS